MYLTKDYQAVEANFHRMLSEAERQHSDFVSGAWVTQEGHWHRNCLQIGLKNYRLDLKEGYFKSINGIMYCDALFGPLLARKEVSCIHIVCLKPFPFDKN